MTISRTVVPALMFALLPFAGCGGSEATYTADSAAACLSSNGADVDPDRENVDYIALDAARGALRAEFDSHEVIVSFHRNASDARDAEEVYEAFDSDSDDRIDQSGNAVMAWSNAPTDEERKTMEGCLG